MRAERGQCIRGRNGAMLVMFDSGPTLVLAQQLRKVASAESGTSE
ncbi:hypothetical protein [Hymenobacter sp. B81]